MNVTLICNQAWTIYVSRVELYRGLKERGHVVNVLSEAVSPEADHQTLLEYRSAIRIINIFKCLYRVYLHQKRQPENHVYILYSSKANILYGGALRLFRKKYICVVAGLGHKFSANFFIRFCFITFYRAIAKGSKGVFVMNSHDFRLFEGRVGGTNLQQIKCEGFSVDSINPIQFALSRHIIMVSRLLPEKGIFVFLEAVNLARKKYNLCGYKFLLIGKFDITHNVDKHLLRASAQDAGVFLVEDAKSVKEYFRTSDCFIFPSRYYEGMPRVLFEAAEHGSYIITSDYPGCADFIDFGFEGEVVKASESEFAEKLADAVVRYVKLDDAKKLRMKKSNANRTIEVGRVAEVLDKYEKVFSECS